MILRESNDDKYAGEYEGVMERGTCRIEYRVNYPVYLALTGQTEALEALIREGMEPQGVTSEIVSHLAHPMYLRIVTTDASGIAKTTPVGLMLDREANYCDAIKRHWTSIYYTTAEAAVLGHQYGTLQMLFQYGVCLDLRIDRTRDIFRFCEDEHILRYVREKPECHAKEQRSQKRSNKIRHSKREGCMVWTNVCIRLRQIILEDTYEHAERLERYLSLLRREVSCGEQRGLEDAVAWLLFLAAENHRRDLFEKLLTCREKQGILLTRNMMWKLERQESDLFWAQSSDILKRQVWSHMQADMAKRGPFISSDPEYLDMILAAGYDAAEDSQTEKESEKLLWLGPALGTRTTTAPDLYLAVVSGNAEVVRWLLARGAQICDPFRLDQKNDIFNYFELYQQEQEASKYDTSYMPEAGYRFHNPDNWSGNNYWEIWKGGIHDLFTAAVYSGKTEMTDLVLGWMEQIRWNRSMERTVAAANPAMSRYLLQKVPELLDHIHLSAIVAYKNRTLLAALIRKKKKEMEPYLEELVFFFQWEKNINRNIYSMTVCEPETTSAKVKRLLKFYSLLRKVDASASTALAIRRHIMRLLGENQYDPEITDQMVSYFHEIDPGLCEDYTNWSLDVIKMVGAGKKQPFLSVCQYEELPDEYPMYIMSVREQIEMLLWMRPSPIRPQTDSVTENVLDMHSIKALKCAIKTGYISPVNALSLYEYAIEYTKCDESILLQLAMEYEAEYGKGDAEGEERDGEEGGNALG